MAWGRRRGRGRGGAVGVMGWVGVALPEETNQPPTQLPHPSQHLALPPATLAAASLALKL